jgi:hypothetical protein
MAEKERVNLEDVVEILAKHSASPNDPDDADTLSRFNQQVADDRSQEGQERAKEPPSQPVSKGKEKP